MPKNDTKTSLNRRAMLLAKACFGHPSPSKQQKLTRPLMPPAAPIRPRHLVPTQQAGRNIGSK
ncbi:hypothetical protein [Bathymodiolus japonicus methanotrophic gill symbiont]|uniref:hypothetical protein n=1 Tax=Bathymodiolus japonicus methanotrophic gill symbiont TaxID=113269 RepID=UPI001C8E444F|nr:hypothetical protein [Bathymodiolus japonicus methanotrophic gill symbiont]